MLYVNVIRESASKSSKIMGAAALSDEEVKAAWDAVGAEKPFPYTFENRNDWKSYAAAEEVATALNKKAGKVQYIATDSGPYVSPRYDVMELPKVGDAVSYAFNGDYYPCGKIKSMSPGPGFRRIVAGPDFTGKDRVFWRRCQNGEAVGGAWVNAGTWSLVPGTIEKRNPEF